MIPLMRIPIKGVGVLVLSSCAIVLVREPAQSVTRSTAVAEEPIVEQQVLLSEWLAACEDWQLTNSAEGQVCLNQDSHRQSRWGYWYIEEHVIFLNWP